MARKKASRGFSLYKAILLGITLNDIPKRLSTLEYKLERKHILHSFGEGLIPDLLENKSEEELNSFLDFIKSEVDSINREIKGFNGILSLVGIENRIVYLDYKLLGRIIRERFSSVFSDDKTRQLGDENFRIKLSNEFYKTVNSIDDLLKFLRSSEEFEEKSSLKEKYKKGITEAIDIFSIGHYETAVFIVGRTIETLLDDLLKKAMADKLINRIKLCETKYQSKIGILREHKIIDEKEWHQLNSIRIDRNDTGHPIHKKIRKTEARLIISKSVLIINKLQKEV